MVAASQPVNMTNIREWSEKEGAPEKYARFEELLKKKGRKKPGKGP
jgi:hypothetical protein